MERQEAREFTFVIEPATGGRVAKLIFYLKPRLEPNGIYSVYNVHKICSFSCDARGNEKGYLVWYLPEENSKYFMIRVIDFPDDRFGCPDKNSMISLSYKYFNYAARVRPRIANALYNVMYRNSCKKNIRKSIIPLLSFPFFGKGSFFEMASII